MKDNRVYNRHDQLEKRQRLRHEIPPSERTLWEYLQQRRMEGVRFRRQVSVGAYVLDFYCPELKLAIEVDGSSHDSEDAQEYDHIRQKTIEAFGIRFLRFTNRQVRYEIEGVLEAIRAWILMERSAPP